MISHPINRVQAIKSKFENLSSESAPIKQRSQLYKLRNECERQENKEKPRKIDDDIYNKVSDNETVSDEFQAEPNVSALYKIDVKRSASDSKASLTRQVSDPGKKLHRSHAFRCDRSQKLTSPKAPKRHGSCNGRSETSEFLKMDRKLSKDRLKKLGNVLEQQMKKENFVFRTESTEAIVGVVKNVDLSPDDEVPAHILAMYAQVVKPKKPDDKQEVMTDSGVSSETENVEDDKTGRVKRMTTQFETPKEHIEPETKTNLDNMEDLAGSSETMKLERKNPHLKLTDTLKKALKQPLPAGPPPKKPPRTFSPDIIDKEKSDTKRKLEKLEQVLMKREAKKESNKNIYDIAEENVSLKRPKEIHYLCTEILDITQRTLLPNQNQENESPLKNCLNKLTCVANHSMSSLPYTKLNSPEICSCSQSSLDDSLRTFMTEKCSKCHINDDKEDRFKCHLNCKCRAEKSEFFISKNKESESSDEHIYDEPYVEGKKSEYGTLNSVKLSASKSFEDLSTKNTDLEATIYDLPAEVRPSTPETKTDFQKLRENFENPKPNRSNSTFNENNSSNRSNPTSQCNRSSTNLNSSSQSNSNLTNPLNRSSSKNSNLNLDEANTTSTNQLNSSNSNLTSQLNRSNSNLNQADSNSTDPKSKPMILTPKPTEFIEDVRFKKKSPERKYATEVKRYKPKEAIGFSLPKKNPQLDVDRENLNRLMNEIYETVTAACNMADSKPGSFPTDQLDGSTSEESVKLTRSLTEKRKNYVRRVSSRLAYLEPKNIKQTRFRHQTSICSYKSEIIDNPYSTFRSWKSFRTSQNNLTRDKMETDSKFNLTDSTGNVLSNEFDSDASIDLSIDEKTGCVDIELPFEPRENGLFNVCLLVGFNYLNGGAYVKNVFPPQVHLPQHIENLIFPESTSGSRAGDPRDQCYSFVLTDERGERAYGYCRRVLPEGATACLPLCYCLIGKYRAPGFYYKVLQEIESQHGSSDEQIQSILQQLFDTDFPNPGEEITITYNKQDFKHTSSAADLTTLKDNLLNDITRHITNRTNSNSSESSNDSTRINKELAKNVTDSTRIVDELTKNVTDSTRIVDELSKNVNDSTRTSTDSINADSVRSAKALKSQFSVDVPNSKNITDNSKCRTMPVMRRSEGDGEYDLSADYYDYENNNGPMRLLLNLDNPKSKTIKQPLDPRAEEESSSQLLDSLGAGLLIKVFGSLLLERKVIIRAERISEVSSRLEALQSALYPFVWQQPLISLIPADIQHELLHAPLPILAGALPAADDGVVLEEGMFIDLTSRSKVLFYQGDEATILPTTSYRTLKTSLQMESTKNKDKTDTKMRNMLISEAFLRFFVDILGDFWKYFRFGERKEDDLGRGDVVFDKDNFIKNAASKQNQYFLEWFTETAMFNHFVQNMAVRYRDSYSRDTSIDTKEKDTNVRSNRPHDSEKPDLLNLQYKLIDCPTPNFYQLFEERVLARRESKGVDRSGYKNALHKRVRLLKSRLKDLVA